MWPKIPSVDQAGLELPEVSLPLTLFQVLGFQVYTPYPLHGGIFQMILKVTQGWCGVRNLQDKGCLWMEGLEEGGTESCYCSSPPSLGWDPTHSGLNLNSLCCWGRPWTSGLPASVSRMKALEVLATMSCWHSARGVRQPNNLSNTLSQTFMHS